MFERSSGKSGGMFQRLAGLSVFLTGTFCRLCRRLVILALLLAVVLSRPCFVFYQLAKQTGLGSGFKRYEWEYAAALERGEDPLREAAETMISRYLPDGKSVRIERDSHYPNKPTARYIGYVQENGKDLFPFWVRAVSDEEETAVPESVSFSERMQMKKDYMAHVTFYTDFKEQLFRYFLLKNNKAYYEEHGGYHVLRLDYPFFQTSDRFALWNYEKGLVLSDFYDMDGMAEIFQKSVDDMRTWQEQIPEDLGQTVRITKDSPEHFLSFRSENEETLQEVVSALCDERRAYNQTLSEDEIGWYAEVMEEQARKDENRKHLEMAQDSLAEGSIQEEDLSRQIAEYYRAVSEGRLEDAKALRGTDDRDREALDQALARNGLEECTDINIAIYRIDGEYDCVLACYCMKVAGIEEKLPSLDMLVAKRSESGWRLIFDLWNDEDISSEDKDMLYDVASAIWTDEESAVWEDETVKEIAEQYDAEAMKLFEEPEVSAWFDAVTSDIRDILEEMEKEEDDGNETAEDETSRNEMAEDETDGDVYLVRRGDCLWKIAEKLLGDGTRWKELYERNKDVIGDDPGMILPGVALTVSGMR